MGSVVEAAWERFKGVVFEIGVAEAEVEGRPRRGIVGSIESWESTETARRSN